MDNLALFAHRVLNDWLPTYCSNRGYCTSGFKLASLRVDPVDATDCMIGIDQGVVLDNGDGKYRAARSSAHEVLFWEGLRKVSPRPISLWLEPVITFAALARMHTKYAWPKQNLGAQSEGWAFDVAAYDSAVNSPVVLGEIKKSVPELERLRNDLIALSNGAPPQAVRRNSLKKWNALLATRPRVVWLLGPAEQEYIYAPSYRESGLTFHAAPAVELRYGAA